MELLGAVVDQLTFRLATLCPGDTLVKSTDSSAEDLVVDDDVDGAAGLIGGQVTQVKRLVDHTLTGESRVTVYQHAHHLTIISNSTGLHLQSVRCVYVSVCRLAAWRSG